MGVLLFALFNAGSAENQKLIAAAGGIEAAVAAMKQHASNGWVQMNGCGALQNIAYNNAETQSLIAAAGGIEAVVAAMKQHASNARVRKYGCGTLWAIASNNSDHHDAMCNISGQNPIRGTRYTKRGADYDLC